MSIRATRYAPKIEQAKDIAWDAWDRLMKEKYKWSGLDVSRSETRLDVLEAEYETALMLVEELS